MAAATSFPTPADAATGLVSFGVDVNDRPDRGAVELDTELSYPAEEGSGLWRAERGRPAREF